MQFSGVATEEYACRVEGSAFQKMLSVQNHFSQKTKHHQKGPHKVGAMSLYLQNAILCQHYWLFSSVEANVTIHWCRWRLSTNGKQSDVSHSSTSLMRVVEHARTSSENDHGAHLDEQKDRRQTS